MATLNDLFDRVQFFNTAIHSSDMDMDVEDSEPEFFKPENKGFFSLLIESFKFFTLNLPAIATIVIPVFLVVEFLVPLLELFIPDFADDLTGSDFVNDLFNDMFKGLVSLLIGSIIGGIAWIAVIRVIAAAMHGEKLPPIQAMKDGITMLPMFIVTALLFYVSLIIGFTLLIIPGIILFVWFSFWQFSYVLRGKGAVAALLYSKSLVDGDFVRVFLNILGITVVMYLLNNFGISLIADFVAGNVGEEGDIPYVIVNAIFVGLGRVFEGIRIIFLMTLFMDLEKD